MAEPNSTELLEFYPCFSAPNCVVLCRVCEYHQWLFVGNGGHPHGDSRHGSGGTGFGAEARTCDLVSRQSTFAEMNPSCC